MQKIPNHHHQRATIADFICPDDGFRGKQTRLGVQPKNHMKDNLRDLRNLDARKKEEREENSKSQKDLYKLSQFKDISSRVYENENDDKELVNNGEFLSKGLSDKRREDLAARRRMERLELEARLEENRHYSEAPQLSPRKTTVPRSDEVARLNPRSMENFIDKNKVTMQLMKPQRKQNDKEPVAKHEEFGRVPKYLEDRKNQWEEEKEDIRRRAPDPNCPAGMRLMGNDERLDTLDILQSNREEALRQLSKLPFVIETPSAIKKKIDIEMKLKEIESAIALFSRPKVYIKQ